MTVLPDEIMRPENITTQHRFKWVADGKSVGNNLIAMSLNARSENHAEIGVMTTSAPITFTSRYMNAAGNRFCLTHIGEPNKPTLIECDMNHTLDGILVVGFNHPMNANIFVAIVFQREPYVPGGSKTPDVMMTEYVYEKKSDEPKVDLSNFFPTGSA